MRPDQTDSGTTNQTTKTTNKMTSRPSDTNREVPIRTESGEEAASLPRRERAGSPSPAAIEGAPSWEAIKSRFVDDPAGAIAAAEQLVRQALNQRVRALQAEAETLCAPNRDDEASSTEAMRTRLIRYQQYCSRG